MKDPWRKIGFQAVGLVDEIFGPRVEGVDSLKTSAVPCAEVVLLGQQLQKPLVFACLGLFEDKGFL